MSSGFQGTPYFRRCSRELVSNPAISLTTRSWRGKRRTTSPCRRIGHDLVRKLTAPSPKKSGFRFSAGVLSSSKAPRSEPMVTRVLRWRQMLDHDVEFVDISPLSFLFGFCTSKTTRSSRFQTHTHDLGRPVSGVEETNNNLNLCT